MANDEKHDVRREIDKNDKTKYEPLNDHRKWLSTTAYIQVSYYNNAVITTYYSGAQPAVHDPLMFKK